MTSKERKIQIVKELVDKKEITFEQGLILLDFDINPVKSTIISGTIPVETYVSTKTCTGNCDNCSCKK
jgi:hypothetical protein